MHSNDDDVKYDYKSEWPVLCIMCMSSSVNTGNTFTSRYFKERRRRMRTIIKKNLAKKNNCQFTSNQITCDSCAELKIESNTLPSFCVDFDEQWSSHLNQNQVKNRQLDKHIHFAHVKCYQINQNSDILMPHAFSQHNTFSKRSTVVCCFLWLWWINFHILNYLALCVLFLCNGAVKYVVLMIQVYLVQSVFYSRIRLLLLLSGYCSHCM